MLMDRCVVALVLSLWLVPGSGTLAQDAYEVLLPFEDIRYCPPPGCCQYDLLGVHCFEGTTAYAIVRGIESTCTPEWESQLTKIENITGTPTTTELMSYTAWKAHVGADPADNILPGNRMAVIGDYVQYLDVGIDGIYRVHKTTGAITTLVSAADINTHTGAGAGNLIDAVGISPTNDMTFYDQTSDSMLSVDSAGNLTTEITAAEFLALYGVTTVNAVRGGITYDASGRLYWTLASQNHGDPAAYGAVYRRDCDGTLSELVPEADIILASGSFDPVFFWDLYYAPDGLIYFYHGGQSTDSIMYFDPVPVQPSTPSDTLGVLVNQQELQDGPGTDNLGSFNTFGGQLTWSTITRDAPDIYAKDLVRQNIVPADLDKDGDVDGQDFLTFSVCYNGPLRTPSSGCENDNADLDCDGDVDGQDFLTFSVCYNGSLRPPQCD